jgi:hypothetical protein
MEGFTLDNQYYRRKFDEWPVTIYRHTTKGWEVLRPRLRHHPMGTNTTVLSQNNTDDIRTKRTKEGKLKNTAPRDRPKLQSKNAGTVALTTTTRTRQPPLVMVHAMPLRGGIVFQRVRMRFLLDESNDTSRLPYNSSILNDAASVAHDYNSSSRNLLATMWRRYDRIALQAATTIASERNIAVATGALRNTMVLHFRTTMDCIDFCDRFHGVNPVDPRLVRYHDTQTFTSTNPPIDSQMIDPDATQVEPNRGRENCEDSFYNELRWLQDMYSQQHDPDHSCFLTLLSEFLQSNPDTICDLEALVGHYKSLHFGVTDDEANECCQCEFLPTHHTSVVLTEEDNTDENCQCECFSIHHSPKVNLQCS